MVKKTKTVKKPWGAFEEFATNEKVTVKIITVNKGGILSLQSHKHRTELWVALDSGLIAVVGARKAKLSAGQKITIPKGAKHRIMAARKARFLEISFGRFDENDIVRYEDVYGRISKQDNKSSRKYRAL
ncbi:MAG TPA: mannose-6-phosphate isomerase [Candidatus Diapherotrites archaeon]|uniref:Mannose-6-phosphate isomerase n=1 Tax=Candidatus Iainarchaeum sp. TaxID=3101447 RepID=A0A7J4IXX3_9ARCH|nr:mannose-6-phosphate isomerase [Candidatus Diapherotrites archaeon]